MYLSLETFALLMVYRSWRCGVNRLTINSTARPTSTYHPQTLKMVWESSLLTRILYSSTFCGLGCNLLLYRERRMISSTVKRDGNSRTSNDLITSPASKRE